MCADEIGEVIKKTAQKYPDILSIFGPAPAPIEKIRNNYRFRILVKCNYSDSVHGIMREIYENHEKGRKRVYLTLDVNPVNMF